MWIENSCELCLELRHPLFGKSEGVVAQWCNPLTLKSEQSDGMGSSPGRTPPLERHDKRLRTRLGLLFFCDPSAWR